MTKIKAAPQMRLFSNISAYKDERSARLAGIGLMLLSIFMFSFGDAMGKFIVATYSVGQLLLLRGADRAVAVDLAASRAVHAARTAVAAIASGGALDPRSRGVFSGGRLSAAR